MCMPLSQEINKLEHKRKHAAAVVVWWSMPRALTLEGIRKARSSRSCLATQQVEGNRDYA